MRKGIIYKIICSISDEVYVGSTFNKLNQRFSSHKSHYRECKKWKKSMESSKTLFEKYGIENTKIMKIREYNVVDKKHLRAYEQLWINYFKHCVNKICSFNPLKKHLHKIYKKEWANTPQVKKQRKTFRDIPINKVNSSIKHKKYYQKNKELIKKKNKDYYHQNKKEVGARQKKYRIKNRIEVRRKQCEKIKCLCGGEYTRSNKSRHFKTTKHKNN